MEVNRYDPLLDDFRASTTEGGVPTAAAVGLPHGASFT